MAAAILPKPGSKYLCKKPCEHTDCANIRRIARTGCTICYKRIGYGVRFYDDDNHNFVHAVCLEKKVVKTVVSGLI